MGDINISVFMNIACTIIVKHIDMLFYYYRMYYEQLIFIQRHKRHIKNSFTLLFSFGSLYRL